MALEIKVRRFRSPADATSPKEIAMQLIAVRIADCTLPVEHHVNEVFSRVCIGLSIVERA